ncbi:unnamed protein product, partial [Staurois parvus]
MSCQSAPAPNPLHCCISVPAHQCHLSVPISAAYQCP